MRYALILTSLIMFGCGSSEPGTTQKVTPALFDKGVGVGIADEIYEEASGLEVSRANPGHLWTHNDSGGLARLFLMNDSAQVKAIVRLDGIVHRDWEDITLGAGPEEGKNYLYIAETGDNYAQYATKYIYRFEEPKLELGEEIVERSISAIDTIAIQYEDGQRDAETLMIDELTRDLYIVSKREEEVGVYYAKYPQSTEGLNILPKLGSIPFNKIVAGDISKDREILLKNYDNVFYWKIDEGKSIYETLSKKPIILPYKPEPQGEAITWAEDGKGYYTLSEKSGGKAPSLLYYKRN